MSHPIYLALVVCLGLAMSSAAQDQRKVAQPLPRIDLDHKVESGAAPAIATPPVIGAQDAPAGAARERIAKVVLPSGRSFTAGLPRDQVVFDDQGDVIWVEGANYKASFTASTFTFVPYFGADAPQNYPLALSLESARLGEAVQVLSAAAPRRSGSTIRTGRGSVVERYDVAPDRVEQQFVLDAPFAGDLVLTLRVATELSASRDAAGLRFTNALGHVGYTSAVLVDAAGRRTAMSTAYADGRITLRAPAPAIASATFPLTVDPVVATFAPTNSLAHVLTGADIAFSGDSGHYLVVWTRVFSATDTDLHSMAIDANGVVVPGGSALLDNSGDRWDGGRVACCSPNFLAVASRTPVSGSIPAIWGRTRAVNGTAMGPQFQISDTEAGGKYEPDVGGEFDNPVNFCVVWRRDFSATDHDIHYRMVSAAGTVTGAVGLIDNSSANDDYRPRIAKSDGTFPPSEQIWPVVWQRRLANGRFYVHGARVRWDGALASPPFAVESTGSGWDPSPTSLTDSIDGSKYWLVSFTVGAFGNDDIHVKTYRDGAPPQSERQQFLYFLEGLGAPERALHQFGSRADCDGRRFAVSYVERFGSTDHDAYVTTLELTPAGLRAIDPRAVLSRATLDTHAVGIVANRSGGGASLRYGTVWDLNTAGGAINSSIHGAVYLGVTPRGGFATRTTACGGLGISFAGGNQFPAPGTTLQFDLTGVAGPALFVIGVPTPALSLCPPASCMLGASLTITIPGTSLRLAVPHSWTLVGDTLAVQGIALGTPGGCAGYGDLATSNTVDVTIR